MIEDEAMRASLPFCAPELFGGDYRNMRNTNAAKADVWSVGSVITYLMCGEEYWPKDIEDIKLLGLGWTGDEDAEMCRIVEAKSNPTDLLKLIRPEWKPSKKETKLAEVVRACTSYNPNLRPSLEDLEVSLWELVGNGQGAESRPAPVDTQHVESTQWDVEGVGNETLGKPYGDSKMGGRGLRGLLALVAAASVLCLLVLPPFFATDGLPPGCVAARTAPNGHTYALMELNNDWESAIRRAESFGGHLATIASPEEQRVVEGILALGTRNSYWLGGSLGPDESWAWVTGEQFGYKNWATDQPDNFLVRTSLDDVPSAPVEDALVVYRVTNEQAADDGRGFFGFWNDLPRNGDCGGEAFFGVNNIGAIYEWDNGLPHASGL